LKKALRLGKGQVEAHLVDVIAPGGEDVDHLIGHLAAGGAHRGLDPGGRDQPHPVAHRHPQVARQDRAHGDASGEIVNLANGLRAATDARDRGQFLGRDAKDLGALGGLAVGHHHLAADQRRGTSHAGHGAQLSGERVIIGETADPGAAVVDAFAGVDGDMGIGAQDGIDEFGANPARTASVTISAKTASVMPISEIQVITLTPPSARRARR
jgi:hypothetical protein